MKGGWTTQYLIRRFVPGDDVLIEAFLAGHFQSSLFLLSNIQRAGLADRGGLYEGTYVGAFQGDTLVGVVGHFWNDNLILQAPQATVELATAVVRLSGRRVAGLIGPWEQVSAARTGLRMQTFSTRLDSKEVLYALDLDDLRIPPRLTDGKLVCRRSYETDIPLLVEWRLAEATEIFGDTASRQETRAALERNHSEGNLFVLEDSGQLVAISTFNATLPRTVQIGGVYTPQDFRRRGYARSVVAGSLLVAQDLGAESAVLFTGEGNAPARRAYENLGFEVAGDYGIILFRKPAANHGTGA